jgi:hypothetical protein
VVVDHLAEVNLQAFSQAMEEEAREEGNQEKKFHTAEIKATVLLSRNKKIPNQHGATQQLVIPLLTELKMLGASLIVKVLLVKLKL